MTGTVSGPANIPPILFIHYPPALRDYNTIFYHYHLKLDNIMVAASIYQHLARSHRSAHPSLSLQPSPLPVTSRQQYAPSHRVLDHILVDPTSLRHSTIGQPSQKQHRPFLHPIESICAPVFDHRIKPTPCSINITTHTLQPSSCPRAM